jgi:hypothetical protein
MNCWASLLMGKSFTLPTLMVSLALLLLKQRFIFFAIFEKFFEYGGKGTGAMRAQKNAMQA